MMVHPLCSLRAMLSATLTVVFVCGLLLPLCVQGFLLKSSVLVKPSWLSRPLCSCATSTKTEDSSRASDSNSIVQTKKRNILIVGGGFGGLYTALQLSKQVNTADTNLILVDPKDRFVFLPLLYELAVGSASPVEVSPRYADLLAGSAVSFLQGSVDQIDFKAQQCSVKKADNQLECMSYDQLVIAVGNQPRVDMIPGARQFSLPFYGLQDAYRLQLKLEKLKREKKGFIRVTVMGAGYSGIELATNVAQYLGKKRAAVTIVNRNNKVLPSSSDHNRDAALKALKHNNVNVKYNTSVRAVAEKGLILIDETNADYFFESDLTLFTAGTEQSNFVKKLPLTKDEYGRILTKRTLQSVDHPNVFALGDCGGIKGYPLPGTAQVAMQQTSIIAKNIEMQWRQSTASSESEKERYVSKFSEFTYYSLGEMLSLGDTDATITSLGGYVALKGPLAALGRRMAYAARMPTVAQSVKAVVTAGTVASGKLFSNVFKSDN